MIPSSYYIKTCINNNNCVLIIIYFQVSVDGEMVKSVDLFDEGLTLTELKVINILILYTENNKDLVEGRAEDMLDHWI